MKCRLIILFLLPCYLLQAQKTAQQIEKGNDWYRKKEYAQAKEAYTKALKADQSNTIAQFNSGNADHRLKNYEKAAASFEAAATSSRDPYIKAQALYNQGNALVKQNKIAEAINAYKNSLRLNPNDNDVRENLQKALKELNKQQQQQKNGQNNKNQPNQKDPPQKPRSKYDEDLMDQKLKELANEEKKLQKQLQEKSRSSRQVKDW